MLEKYIALFTADVPAKDLVMFYVSEKPFCCLRSSFFQSIHSFQWKMKTYFPFDCGFQL